MQIISVPAFYQILDIDLLSPIHAQATVLISYIIDFKVAIRMSRNCTALDMLNVSSFLSGRGSTSTNQRTGLVSRRWRDRYVTFYIIYLAKL